MTPLLHDDSERGLPVLVVSPDPALEEEFVGAMADVSMHRSLLQSAPAFRSALEAARTGRRVEIDIDAWLAG